MNKWWTETDFTFNGVKATEFLWPKDRPIFVDLDGDHCRVPTFVIKEDLDGKIKEVIEVFNKEYTKDEVHISIFEILEKPYRVGLLANSEKPKIVTDFFED